MKSFHGKQEIKDKYVARLAEHHRLDQIIQGTGFNGSQGCAVGCTLDNYSHEAYESELGLPKWIAHLEDKIFEGLSKEKAPQFAMDFLQAVPVGVSVENVKWNLAISRHTRQIKRLQGNTEPYAEECRKALQGAINYCQKMLEEKFDAAESARSARSAAWSEYEIEASELIEFLKHCK